MKRDMDLVRQLMLQLEALHPEDGLTILEPPFSEIGLPEWSPETIGQHLTWIYQAGFVTGAPYDARAGFTFSGLSWAGCDFLDSVRDPEVWKETKGGMAKVGGWTVDLLKDAAKAYLKMKAKNVLGLDL